MDRVFLDANVLLSAAYGSPGLPRLWARQTEGRCRLVSCALAVEEARRNLDTPAQVRRLERYVREVEIAAQPWEGAAPESLPEGDRLIFLAAVAARATHLLTGDARHFGALYGRKVQGVKVLRPGEYLR